MLEGVNNVLKRIKTINEGTKNLGSFKPEVVQEFEKMYNEAMSKKIEKKETLKAEDIHPFLKNKNESEEEIHQSKKIKNKRYQIDDAIKLASEKYKLSEDLIRAVIQVESNYDQFGVSKAGAMGLMQLMPKTALKLGVEKPFDIYENIDGGSRYLKMMIEKYDGDIDKSLAAYNAGPHSVDLSNGIPDIEETINYVKKIKKLLFK